MHIRTLTLLALFAAAPLSGAQQSSPPRPNLDLALNSWRVSNGFGWECAQDRETGWAQMLYGGHTQAPATEPREDADFVALAQAALRATAPLHGLEASTLVFQDTVFLPLGQIGSNDKQTVRFRQAVADVPVEGAFLNLLFSARGELLSVQSTGLPGASAIATQPALDAADGAASARARFAEQTLFEATSSGTPELVIAQVLVHGQRTGRLAWKVECSWEVQDTEPIGKRVYVDAHTGALLRLDEMIHHFSVSGNVKTMASPGLLPDIGSNPETSQTAPYLKCTAGALTVFTDVNGNFNFPTLNVSTAVTFKYVGGTYATVNYSPGTDYSLVQTIPANTPTNVNMNPSSTATVTPQANGYLVASMMRDWIVSLVPSDVHGNFVTAVNTNVSGSCNAFYNGTSINFYPAAGSCVNSAYSTVISHEQGHWMNDRYNTNNGSDGMGEGNADVWSMYLWDTPVIGANFQGSSYIRSGTNLTQFCGDANGGCYGEVHTDGEVWMGAAWKVRNNLNTLLGNVPGDLAANLLFLGWMNTYNQTQIKSIIETQWMTLDDDDGNIGNGAPHFAQIDSAFRTQGFPGLTISCPAPTPACIDSPNSFSPTGAHMGTAGSISIAANNLQLTCFLIPPFKLTVFYYGRSSNSFLPFGNGTRCVDAPLYRLSAVTSNDFGDATKVFNLLNVPPGGNMLVGNHMSASAFYRDPASGGAAFNTADVIEFNWCP